MKTKDKIIDISVIFSDVYQPNEKCKDGKKEKCGKWEFIYKRADE